MMEAEYKFVEDQTLPEQWFAWFKSFNSQMGGCRTSIDHPKLGRYLYNQEHSLIGVLRGLEHRDSVYRDILELVLDTEADETTARLSIEYPKIGWRRLTISLTYVYRLLFT